MKKKLCNTRGDDNSKDEFFFPLQILYVLNCPEVENTAEKLQTYDYSVFHRWFLSFLQRRTTKQTLLKSTFMGLPISK